jgi:lysophospholipase L1-like esterase
MPRATVNLGVLVASLVLALAISEGLLRLGDFSFDIAPEAVEFGSPIPERMEQYFVPDPDVFWVREGYGEAVEQLKRTGAHIVFLGDSCTAMGTYPDHLLKRLERAYPGLETSAMRLAELGWSSYQGLRQLERDVVPARPRIATFYFGWNDHWTGFGIEDKEIHALRISAYPGLRSFRSAQLVFKGLVLWRASAKRRMPNRVSPEDFRHNMRQMVRISRAAGIIPVLLTAPTSHEIGHEPQYLADRFLRDLSELVPLHRQYVEIVREVARAEGALLCDLARAFEAIPRDELRETYFQRDGVHATKRGDRRIAKLLFQCFEEREEVRAVWLTPLRKEPSRRRLEARWESD